MTDPTPPTEARPYPDKPWLSEPPRLAWTDTLTGLDCLILRGHRDLGVLCGYVRVPPGHPLHGLKTSDPVPAAIREHGERARARPVNMDKVNAIGLWLHAAGDAEGMPVWALLRVHQGAGGGEPNPEGNADDDGWWFSFHGAHAGDYWPGFEVLSERLGIRWPTGTYRNIEFFMGECESLAAQLHRLHPTPRK